MMCWARMLDRYAAVPPPLFTIRHLPQPVQWQYYFTLRDEGFASSFFTKFNASVERWLMPFVYADLRKGLGRALKLSKRHRQASLKAVDEVCDKCGYHLSIAPYAQGSPPCVIRCSRPLQNACRMGVRT